ncbi:Follicle cell protein 3C [Carabus blaptoides fortunei]
MKISMILLLCFTPIFINMCLCEKVSAIGPCECAVFLDQEVKMSEKPIIKQNPMNVTCDTTGQETCITMCTALAQASKAKGPGLLCSTLQHADAFTAYVFAKRCEAASWTYTNISNVDPICCHAGVPVTCKVK